MLGALKVYDDKLGVSFKVGSGFDDKGRRSPPKIGSIITYKY
jgi:DNA ligase-1